VRVVGLGNGVAVFVISELMKAGLNRRNSGNSNGIMHPIRNKVPANRNNKHFDFIDVFYFTRTLELQNIQI
jgi:hypothetical protein